MAGRPPKHLSLVTGHITKDERKAREAGQKDMTAKAKMRKAKDVQADKIASAHFNRLRSLYAEIGLCDALCENTVNRYCLMLSRLHALGDLTNAAQEGLDVLQASRGDMETVDYMDALAKMMQNMMALERASAKLRDQLLAIERENLLTLAGKLRAVPKQPEEKKAKGGLSAYREKYGGGGSG